MTVGFSWLTVDVGKEPASVAQSTLCTALWRRWRSGQQAVPGPATLWKSDDLTSDDRIGTHERYITVTQTWYKKSCSVMSHLELVAHWMTCVNYVSPRPRRSCASRCDCEVASVPCNEVELVVGECTIPPCCTGLRRLKSPTRNIHNFWRLAFGFLSEYILLPSGLRMPHLLIESWLINLKFWRESADKWLTPEPRLNQVVDWIRHWQRKKGEPQMLPLFSV